MRSSLIAFASLFVLANLSSPAQARGCVKGAVVGGVAGHLAGHHAALGAAAGCVVGHHEAQKKARDTRQAGRDERRIDPRDVDHR